MNTVSYKKYAEKHAKKSKLSTDCLKAFISGGLVCIFSQLLSDIYQLLGASRQNAGSLVSLTLIFIVALLTGLGIFDNIAKCAGAGILVPITGFANSVVSPAIDTKSEGWILGVGAKIFTVAGPVILYGTLASSVWGVIYYVYGLLSR